MSLVGMDVAGACSVGSFGIMYSEFVNMGKYINYLSSVCLDILLRD
jgi:hypothetical protein